MTTATEEQTKVLTLSKYPITNPQGKRLVGFETNPPYHSAIRGRMVVDDPLIDLIEKAGEAGYEVQISEDDPVISEDEQFLRDHHVL
ncbi:hypothetical protein CMI47_11920 [Candidatus Pacearchaeota archaeon]|nr:hypothetical protein [Candidatus Pacearchaeota archaeon]|tara:strand:+ start:255 stop:515 length:261 start_codon:yes stop_codon:yes gene_type:complete